MSCDHSIELEYPPDWKCPSGNIFCAGYFSNKETLPELQRELREALHKKLEDK